MKLKAQSTRQKSNCNLINGFGETAVSVMVNLITSFGVSVAPAFDVSCSSILDIE